MARTAIPIDVIANYQTGTALTETAGDAANDHSVDLTYAPKLMLYIRNSSAVNTVAFTIEFPQSEGNYQNAAQSKSYSIDAYEHWATVLDVPPEMAQTGNLLHIDSADANFSDLLFSAYTWEDTPKV